MKFSILTLRIMTLSIMSFRIMKFRISTFSIMTVSIVALVIIKIHKKTYFLDKFFCRNKKVLKFDQKELIFVVTLLML